MNKVYCSAALGGALHHTLVKKLGDNNLHSRAHLNSKGWMSISLLLFSSGCILAMRSSVTFSMTPEQASPVAPDNNSR